MKLSIIIPAYNEALTLEQTVTKVFSVVFPCSIEVFIVNDGSTDETTKIVTDLAIRYPIIPINHDHNQGKGAAITHALAQVTGEYVVIQDADSEYNPEDILLLLRVAQPSGVVYGVRTYKSNWQGYWFFVLGNWLMNVVVQVITRQKLKDIYTCYKLVPVVMARQLNLESRGFEIEAEITAKLAQTRTPFTFVPIHYYPRTYQQGKHIKLSDGIKGFWVFLKYYYDIK